MRIEDWEWGIEDWGSPPARSPPLHPTSTSLTLCCLNPQSSILNPIVENLCTNRALPVDGLSEKRKVRVFPCETRALLLSCASSYCASLAPIVLRPHNRHPAVTPVTSTPTLVRFEDTINGRPVVIEVSSVGRDRWRAQIVRMPGGRTALMPFYGTTAEQAAENLSGWLTRASKKN